MRESIRQFVSIIAETLPIREPIYEFGALQVPGQEGFANLRPLFPGKEYVGCDMREGPGVDRVLNLHALDLPDATAGTVLMLDTLEHVEYPREALAEVHRIIRPEGMLVISSVMDWPIHDYPYDYWRFTPEAFRSLLKPFDHSFVEHAGAEELPHTVVGIGLRGSPVPMEKFWTACSRWKQEWRHPEGEKRREAGLRLSIAGRFRARLSLELTWRRPRR